MKHIAATIEALTRFTIALDRSPRGAFALICLAIIALLGLLTFVFGGKIG